MINRKFLIVTRKLVRNREEVWRHKISKSWNYKIWWYIQKKTRWSPHAKNQHFSTNWWEDIDSIQYLMTPYKSIQNWIGSKRSRSRPIFRRVYPYSLEHNNAYTSLPICTKRLVFGRRTVFISVLSGYTNLSHNFTNLVFCDVITSLFYSHGQHPNVPTF